MKITGLFVIERHEEYGEVGLRLKSRPWFDPLGGVAVAHDLMEHFNDDDGTLAGELQALGASIYVRDFGCYFSQRGGYITEPHKHIASDMLEQVRLTLDRGEHELHDPGRTRALDDDYAESEIQATLTEACRLIRAEEILDGDLPDWLKGDEQRRRFVGWLRRGFRRARRRYRNVYAGSAGVCGAFIGAEKAIDDFLKHNSDYEGAEVRVTIDTCNGTTIRMIGGEEEW